MPLPTTIAEVVQQQLSFESGTQIYGIVSRSGYLSRISYNGNSTGLQFLGDGLRDALDPRLKL
jgi:hypothetical protein